MSGFERYLTLWVALCIAAGIALGHAAPGAFQAIGALEIARVNLPVAALIWLMIVPMLLRIDFAALAGIGRHWRGIGVTLFVNWAVKPFSMAALAWLFIGVLFRPLLPAAQIESHIAGLILLAAAPCTAMVFVWSNLAKGEPHFTLSQVALNDTIMVFAFAPIVGLLLGLSAISVPWETLALSAALYIVVPVVAAQSCSALFACTGRPRRTDHALGVLHPISLTALLATLVLLFGFQGEAIVEQPFVIAPAGGADPVQVYFNAALAYLAQPVVRRANMHRRPFGPHRRIELFRTRGGDGDRAFRLQLGRGPGDRRRRAGRSPRHALGRRDLKAHPRLVHRTTARRAPDEKQPLNSQT